jgi:hypothetical protein
MPKLNLCMDIQGKEISGKIEIENDKNVMETYEFRDTPGADKEPWELVSSMMKAKELEKISEAAITIVGLIKADKKMNERLSKRKEEKA